VGVIFMALARRSELEITYKGVNISADVSKDLVGFSYTDNETGKADDIEIKLQDRTGRWSREWMPTLGDKVEAKIKYISNGRVSYLNCGTFTLDEFTNESGSSGTTVAFKGASVPQNNTVRRTQKNRAWESVRLSEIASDVANTGGLRLTYSTSVDPLFERKDQNNKSDLQFLKELCDEIALSLKVTNDQLVIFNRDDLEQKDPIGTLIFGSQDVKAWSFTTQNHDTYDESTVEYTDPKTNKKIEHTEKDLKSNSGKKIKKVQRVENKAEAERIAKANLKNKNRKKLTGSISIIGDVRYVAGSVVEIVGFGNFDGKFYIDTATHSVDGGYTTALEISSVLNPKDEKDEKVKAAKQEVKKAAENKKQPKKAKTTPKPAVKKDLNEDEKWIMRQ
jgi:phage protein D